MMPLPLFFSSADSQSAQDFDATVDDDRVTLSDAVEDALERLSIRNADQLVSGLFEAPGVFATELDWPMDRVLGARDRLVQQLKGKVDDALLFPEPPLQVGFGAKGE